jgi:hypothetical protein
MLTVCLLVVGLQGCNPRKTLWEAGLGSFTTDLSVVGAVKRSDWLDVVLEGHGLTLRTFVPADEICSRVLEPGKVVDYIERGIAGRFERDDETCDAVGFGSPLIDRARRGRATSLRTTPIPRAQATFRIIFEDEEVILARGRFPLASTLGWTGSSDTIAAFPNTDLCRVPLENGVASMEYRAAGRRTLTLVSSNGQCPFQGLIQPRGPAPDGKSTTERERGVDRGLAQR